MGSSLPRHHTQDPQFLWIKHIQVPLLATAVAWRRRSAALWASGRKRLAVSSPYMCHHCCRDALLVISSPACVSRDSWSQDSAEEGMRLPPVPNNFGGLCCHIHWKMWYQYDAVVSPVINAWCAVACSPSCRGKRKSLSLIQAGNWLQAEALKKWHISSEKNPNPVVYLDRAMAGSVSLTQSHCTSTCLISTAENRVF